MERNWDLMEYISANMKKFQQCFWRFKGTLSEFMPYCQNLLKDENITPEKRRFIDDLLIFLEKNLEVIKKDLSEANIFMLSKYTQYYSTRSEKELPFPNKLNNFSKDISLDLSFSDIHHFNENAYMFFDIKSKKIFATPIFLDIYYRNDFKKNFRTPVQEWEHHSNTGLIVHELCHLYRDILELDAQYKEFERKFYLEIHKFFQWYEFDSNLNPYLLKILENLRSPKCINYIASNYHNIRKDIEEMEEFPYLIEENEEKDEQEENIPEFEQKPPNFKENQIIHFISSLLDVYNFLESLRESHANAAQSEFEQQSHPIYPIEYIFNEKMSFYDQIKYSPDFIFKVYNLAEYYHTYNLFRKHIDLIKLNSENNSR